ncbi:hypothetical protein CBS101457_001120 [Exobasidium rhododendri]|nr:hypothetical protein CBS101457_001120 [Exobasidium rhododendri]
MVHNTSHIVGVDVLTLAACHIEHDNATKNTLDSLQAIQSAHRLRILEVWARSSKQKDIEDNGLDWSFLQGQVLEMGCGQGDQTAAIAALMGQVPDLTNSVVHGIDPAPSDYGAPFTLKEAQTYLLNSPIAKNICFESHQSAKEALECHEIDYYFSAIFVHSLWYFHSQTEVLDAFTAARRNGVKHLLIAEWDLSSKSKSSVPHMLAVLLQSNKALSHNNVRLPLSPLAIKRLANTAGWTVEHESTLTPEPELHDGRWEVDTATFAAKEYLQQRQSSALKNTEEDLEHISIESHLCALQAHLPLQKSQITSLDIWTCKFVPSI